MNRTIVVAGLMAMTAAGAGARAGVAGLYGSQSTGPSYGLVRFNTAPLDGTSARIGSNGGTGDMDFDSGGLLYAPDFGGLQRIDTGTGAKTLVGAWGSLGGALMQSIAFAPNGTLYAVDYTPNGSRLYTVNKANGHPTLIGAVGSVVFGLEFGPDGTLYGSAFEVFKISTVTGAKGATVATGFDSSHPVQALDYGPDGTWRMIVGEGGLAGADLLYELNISDGSRTLIGATTETDMRALASIPGPGVGAAGIAGAVMMALRRPRGRP